MLQKGYMCISAMESREKGMEENGCCCKSIHSNKVLQNLQPYLLMILVSMCNAGLNFATKVSLDKGMSPTVLAAYGTALGTVVTSAFFLVFERKSRPKMTLHILIEVFLLSLLGLVIGMALYYAGLARTTSTFASVISNLFPPMTFILAILFRMERLEIRKLRSQAKVAGTLLAFGGATLMTLYKGITLISVSSKQPHHPTTPAPTSTADKDWIRGSVMLVASSLSRASATVLQARTIKKYPAAMSLICITCFVGTFQAAVATFAIERKVSVWRLGWDIRLLSIAYNGIMIYGVAIYAQLVVIQRKGPVFVAVFNPLNTVMVAVVDLFVFRQSLNMGSVTGSILVILGLYMVLWGKYRENEKKTERSCQVVDSDQPNTNHDPRKCGAGSS